MMPHRIEWEGGANGQADPTEATILELAGLDPSGSEERRVGKECRL